MMIYIDKAEMFYVLDVFQIVFGYTRGLKYGHRNSGVINVAFVSSGHFWINHAWTNPILRYTYILMSFLLQSIVTLFKNCLK